MVSDCLLMHTWFEGSQYEAAAHYSHAYKPIKPAMFMYTGAAAYGFNSRILVLYIQVHVYTPLLFILLDLSTNIMPYMYS